MQWMRTIEPENSRKLTVMDMDGDGNGTT